MKRFAMVVLTLILGITLLGCQKEVEEKVFEGPQGTTLETMFFNFTVNESYLIDQIGETITKEGFQFLVVDITVENPKEEAVEMVDTDFYVNASQQQYDPLSTYGSDPLLEDELESSYTIETEGKQQGKLIFVVPLDQTAFTFHSQDHYKSSEEEEVVDGDIYTITLSPEQREYEEE